MIETNSNMHNYTIIDPTCTVNLNTNKLVNNYLTALTSLYVNI